MPCAARASIASVACFFNACTISAFAGAASVLNCSVALAARAVISGTAKLDGSVLASAMNFAVSASKSVLGFCNRLSAASNKAESCCIF